MRVIVTVVDIMKESVMAVEIMGECDTSVSVTQPVTHCFYQTLTLIIFIICIILMMLLMMIMLIMIIIIIAILKIIMILIISLISWAG